MQEIGERGPSIVQLCAEVKRLRASLQAVLEEATFDFDRDIIITECQSALRGDLQSLAWEAAEGGEGQCQT